jgi:hypothetical protein
MGSASSATIARAPVKSQQFFAARVPTFNIKATLSRAQRITATNFDRVNLPYYVRQKLTVLRVDRTLLMLGAQSL